MRDSRAIVLGALVGGVAGVLGGIAFCLIVNGLAKASGLTPADAFPFSAGLVVASALVGAVAGAVRFPRHSSSSGSSAGRTLLLWTTNSLLTLGGSLAFGALGGYLGMNLGLGVISGPDFKGSPSPGAGFAAVIVLMIWVGGGAASGVGTGLVVCGLLSLKRQLVWFQIPLAMIGYGLVALGGYQLTTFPSAPPPPSSGPVAMKPATGPSKAKVPAKPAIPQPSESALKLAANPEWQPAESFPTAVAAYGPLIYPGGRASHVPLSEQNEMFVIASGDTFDQVAAYYRARLQVKHDLSDRLIGTAPVADGKTAFVGVSVQDGLTFVSLTCGKAAPP